MALPFIRDLSRTFMVHMTNNKFSRKPLLPVSFRVVKLKWSAAYNLTVISTVVKSVWFNTESVVLTSVGKLSLYDCVHNKACITGLQHTRRKVTVRITATIKLFTGHLYNFDSLPIFHK